MFIEQLIKKCWKTYLNIKTKKGDVIIINVFIIVNIAINFSEYCKTQLINNYNF